MGHWQEHGKCTHNQRDITYTFFRILHLIVSSLSVCYSSFCQNAQCQIFLASLTRPPCHLQVYSVYNHQTMESPADNPVSVPPAQIKIIIILWGFIFSHLRCFKPFKIRCIVIAMTVDISPEHFITS